MQFFDLYVWGLGFLRGFLSNILFYLSYMIDFILIFPSETCDGLAFQVKKPIRNAQLYATESTQKSRSICLLVPTASSAFIIRNISNNRTQQLQQVILLLFFFLCI